MIVHLVHPYLRRENRFGHQKRGRPFQTTLKMCFQFHKGSAQALHEDSVAWIGKLGGMSSTLLLIRTT